MVLDEFGDPLPNVPASISFYETNTPFEETLDSGDALLYSTRVRTAR